MADLAFRVNQVIKTEIDVTQAQLSRNGVEVIYRRAPVSRSHARARGKLARPIDLEAPLIIIATGTKPAVSATVPINGSTIINSDQILNMPEIPKTLIVVGGGVIGVEYTCMFAILGVARDSGGEAPAAARIRRSTKWWKRFPTTCATTA